MTAIALTIAGSDSSGGAGIQADLKTFSALGVYGASAITALTAQNTLGVEAVHVVPPDFVREQIEAVARDLEVGAVKIGMLATSAVIEAVAEGARGVPRRPGRARSGDGRRLAAMSCSTRTPSRRCARSSCRAPRLITPNLPEAAKLLGGGEAKNEARDVGPGAALKRLGAKAVLVKGGHAEGAEAVDILLDGEGELRLAAPRVRHEQHPRHRLHAVRRPSPPSSPRAPLCARRSVAAKAYVTAAIAAADELRIGKGRGPVHHFHALVAETAGEALALGHDLQPLLAQAGDGERVTHRRASGTRADCAPCRRLAACPW